MNVKALKKFLEGIPDNVEVVTPRFDQSYNRKRRAFQVTAALYEEDIKDERGDTIIKKGELVEVGNYMPYLVEVGDDLPYKEVQVVVIG